MKKTQKARRATLTAIVVLTLVLVFGCSSGKEMPAQVSGTWQRTQGEGTVQIQLDQEPLSITMGGRSYPAAIKSIDNGAASVHLDVETEAGQKEEWIIHQVWNDNGSSFTLSFTHSGTHEKLVAGKAS
jgi:hypothetical protein